MTTNTGAAAMLDVGDVSRTRALLSPGVAASSALAGRCESDETVSKNEDHTAKVDATSVARRSAVEIQLKQNSPKQLERFAAVSAFYFKREADEKKTS